MEYPKPLTEQEIQKCIERVSNSDPRIVDIALHSALNENLVPKLMAIGEFFIHQDVDIGTKIRNLNDIDNLLLTFAIAKNEKQIFENSQKHDIPK